MGKLYRLYVVVSHLLHYSTAVLTESAGVWANRFFREAPIWIKGCIHEIGCIMHCLYAVVPHPLCYLAAVLTEKLFPRGTHTKVCICKIGCLCGHLKKEKACCDKLPAVLYQLWFPPKRMLRKTNFFEDDLPIYRVVCTWLLPISCNRKNDFDQECSS